VVNFDLGGTVSEVPATGELARVAVLGVGAVRGHRLPLRMSGGVTPGNFFEIFDAKSRVWAIWVNLTSTT